MDDFKEENTEKESVQNQFHILLNNNQNYLYAMRAVIILMWLRDEEELLNA